MKKEWSLDEEYGFEGQKQRKATIIQGKMIKYKDNHQHLPIVILANHNLLVFTNSPIYKKIYPYLISFAEPLYRPKKMHEYKITKFSLYTAMVLQYTADQIIEILTKISKNEEFPHTLQSQIRKYMRYAGQVKFSLIDGVYYFFANPEVLPIFEHLVEIIGEVEMTENKKEILADLVEEDEPDQGDVDNEGVGMDIENGGERKIKVIKCRVKNQYFEVTKLLIENNIPIIQQYDFQKDEITQNIKIDAVNGIKLRYYQERALRNVFIEGVARSGIIILPCGAGKSLVAIEVIQRIKKKAVIFCESQVSGDQWKNELCKWTTIDPQSVIVFSPKWKKLNPKKIEECSIFITTYAMVGLKRQVENEHLKVSQRIPWGVCIADEVHKLPAETFQNVLKKYRFHLKLGLTATPYREDNKIDNLFYMIGPKLFEENWLDLVNEGCLAKPYCIEILCNMTDKFRQHYKRLGGSELLHTANPNKFKVLQYLLKKHGELNDKVLVFCDRPKILEAYAKKLKLPFIHGETKEEERLKIYNIFKTSRDINVIFLSRVGDTAIDLPCANVGIQVGMHFKSRRQEVQRMGRVMRAKDNPNNEYNAFFYTLLSTGTKEVEYSRTRRETLINQGFPYEIVLADSLNYKGMNLKEFDEKQYLIKLLVEHEEGSKYNQIRAQTSVENIDLLEQNSYFFQEDL